MSSSSSTSATAARRPRRRPASRAPTRASGSSPQIGPARGDHPCRPGRVGVARGCATTSTLTRGSPSSLHLPVQGRPAEHDHPIRPGAVQELRRGEQVHPGGEHRRTGRAAGLGQHEMAGRGDRRGPGMGQVGDEQHPLPRAPAAARPGRRVSRRRCWSRARPSGQRLRPALEAVGRRSGSSGSASGTFSCTGPGRPPAPRRPPTGPADHRPPGRRSGPATVAAQRIRGRTAGPDRTSLLVDRSDWRRRHAARAAGPRTAPPAAPRRDAASRTAGCRLATAVPDVVTTATGRARSPGQAERKEPGGPLVDPHVQPQPPGRVGVVQRQRQRRVAGARGQHRIGHPAGDQLVDQHPGQRGRRVHGRTEPSTVAPTTVHTTQRAIVSDARCTRNSASNDRRPRNWRRRHRRDRASDRARRISRSSPAPRQLRRTRDRGPAPGCRTDRRTGAGRAVRPCSSG